MKWSIAYVLSVLAINVAFARWPELNWLWSIGVGSIFVTRDFCQRAIGHWVVVPMAVGLALSYALASPFVALASAAAFAVSESVDWIVFTVTRRPLADRVLLELRLLGAGRQRDLSVDHRRPVAGGARRPDRQQAGRRHRRVGRPGLAPGAGVICRYRLTIRCACPVDGRSDVYAVMLESPAMIQVEDILEAAAGYETEKVFHEGLTAALAQTLRCQVTTVGWHSGVETTVVAP